MSIVSAALGRDGRRQREFSTRRLDHARTPNTRLTGWTKPSPNEKPYQAASLRCERTVRLGTEDERIGSTRLVGFTRRSLTFPFFASTPNPRRSVDLCHPNSFLDVPYDLLKSLRRDRTSPRRRSVELRTAFLSLLISQPLSHVFLNSAQTQGHCHSSPRRHQHGQDPFRGRRGESFVLLSLSHSSS